MADELLNAQDLITAKKHDTFHSEVITGKAGGLSTGANIDYATNAVTGQVQKTLPATVNGIDWSYVGKFADGVTFTKKSDFAIDANGTQWIYTGSYPFSATAGTVPSEPTYQAVHVKSASAISNANGGSVQDFIDEKTFFNSVQDLKSTTRFSESYLDSNGILVKTKSFYNSVISVALLGGGAEYLLTTLSKARIAKDDPTWVPDGFGDHYLNAGDGQTYVAILQVKDNTLDVQAFGAVADGTTSDSSYVQATVEYAFPNQTVEFTQATKNYLLATPVLITKPLIIKGGCGNKQIDNQSPKYPDTVNILVANGGVGFVCGYRDGLYDTGLPSNAYDSGKVVWDGLQVGPVARPALNTVAIQVNSDHNYEIKNCLFRYLDVGVDVTGAYGSDIHNNMFIGNRLGVISHPDYANGFGNPVGGVKGGGVAGWETNDIRIHHNTFSGTSDFHVYFNGFGHGLTVNNNSFEQSAAGIYVAGYTGTKPSMTVKTWFTFLEFGNYYENIPIPVTIGDISGTGGNVVGVNVGVGTDVNAKSDADKYPFCKVNKVTNFTYKSPTFYGLSAGITDYNEIIFPLGAVISGKVDIVLQYKYSGQFNIGDATKQQDRKISNLGRATNPVKVFVNPNAAGAVGRFDTNASGGFLSTNFDAGTSSMPFKSLNDVSDWLTRTPIGTNLALVAKKLEIDITGSTGSIGALVGVRDIPEILVSSTATVDASFGINNCSDTVLSANLTNGATAYFGKILQTDTNITCRNMSFTVTAPPTTGTAWFSVTNGRLSFDNCTTPTGQMKYIARGKNGAIIFENSSIASGAEISIGTKDAGQAALIVTA